jgi:hypothetical protein
LNLVENPSDPSGVAAVIARQATRTVLVAVLACLLVALAAPAVASAATEFTVDNILDERDEDLSDGVCKANVAETNPNEGTCTLRAAIEEVNEQEGAENKIKFDPGVFEGEEEDAIFVASLLGSLPAIEFPTKIEAGSECTADGIEGAPCAGLIGLEATGNWIGIGLNGSNALPAAADGILLEPGSDEATIGGSLEADRNVIATSSRSAPSAPPASSTRRRRSGPSRSSRAAETFTGLS